MRDLTKYEKWLDLKDIYEGINFCKFEVNEIPSRTVTNGEFN